MSNAPDFAACLKQIPLFRELSADECMDVVRACAIKPTKAGTVLCREGEAGDALFVVESGEVRVTARTLQGLDEELGRQGARSVVGEMSLLDGRPRSATVTVSADGTIWRLARSEFDLLRAHLRPAAFKVIRYLAGVLCARLRELDAKVEEFWAHPEQALQTLRKRQAALQADLKARMAARASGVAPAPSTPAGQAPRRPLALPMAPFVPTGRDPAQDRAAFLARMPVFNGMKPEDLLVLAGILSDRRLAAGEVLCREGEPGNAFYVIASGKLAVHKQIPGGAPQLLATLGPGALLGEISLIDGKRRSATATAREPVFALRCAHDDFDRLFRAGSPLAFRFVDRIATDLCGRVREADFRYTDLFSRPADTVEQLNQRLAALNATLERPEEDDEDPAALLRKVGYRDVPSGG